LDITKLDRPHGDCRLDTSKAQRITSDLDYLDLIFTQRPEDLHEVVTDEALIAAIKKLTRCQKDALFLRMQPHTKTKQAAEDLGSSPRNIRKHLAKAREKIFKEIGEPL
jgi:DNA-directed RNA polymerase specialized sigma24 family protein